MSKIITFRDFENPCKCCGGTLYNKASGKCTQCINRLRLDAVLRKCAGQPQRREPESYLSKDDILRKKLMLERHYMHNVRYENVERVYD